MVIVCLLSKQLCIVQHAQTKSDTVLGRRTKYSLQVHFLQTHLQFKVSVQLYTQQVVCHKFLVLSQAFKQVKWSRDVLESHL